MPAIALLAQHVRAIDRVAGPRGPMELEALAVAASPVTAGAREDCLEVSPGCLVGRDDARPQRRIPHADTLPQGRWRDQGRSRRSAAPVCGSVPRAERAMR